VFVEPQTAFGLDMVADALKRTKPVGGKLDVNAFARAMETARVKTPMGEARMRAEDHQILLPLVVSTVSKDARYKVDDTDLGFKPVKVFSADEAASPVQSSCKMQRPA
jgi:branched-chain amino acid transport system substrate-binding protein